MAEHTPGPYKRFAGGDRIVSDDPRTGVIATVHRNAGPGEEPAQFEANADLFAAAPETAAERDRLRGRMEKLRWMVQSGYPRKNILEEFDAALATAKPKEHRT